MPKKTILTEIDTGKYIQAIAECESAYRNLGYAFSELPLGSKEASECTKLASKVRELTVDLMAIAVGKRSIS